MAEAMPIMMQGINSEIQETLWTPKRINMKEKISQYTTKTAKKPK